MNFVRLVMAGAMLLWSGSLLAVNPRTQVSQYAHTAWRVEDGVLKSEPLSIAQTHDGYLWIGTAQGLLQFDGMKFRSWSPPGEQAFQQKILSLFVAKDGTLWFSTESRLFHWNGTHLTRFRDHRGGISDIVEDANGVIWVSRENVDDYAGPLCRADKDSLHCFGKAEGLDEYFAGSLAIDPAGDMWLGGKQALFRFHAGAFSKFSPRSPKTGKDLIEIPTISPDPHGGLWVGFGSAGLGQGLQHFHDGTFQSIREGSFDSSNINATITMVDRDGALWVGTIEDGLFRISGTDVEHYKKADGLSGNAVGGLFQDQEGDIWVITDQGLDRFRDLSVVTYSAAQHLAPGNVLSVLANRDGSLWVQSELGLRILRGDVVSSLGASDGFPGASPTSILQDHAGVIWLGVDNSLYRYQGGKFQKITKQGEADLGVVASLVEAKDGTLWISAGDPWQLFTLKPSEVIPRLVGNQPDGPVWLITADNQSGVWVLSAAGAVTRFWNGKSSKVEDKLLQQSQADQILQGKDGTVYVWSTRGVFLVRNQEVRFVPNVQTGLCQMIDSWIFDHSGDLWVASRCGLTRFKHEEIEQWWSSPVAKSRERLVLDRTDGFASDRHLFSPRVTVSEDGRIWFAGDSGVHMLDPAHLAVNSKPPPVYIEALLVDRLEVAMSNAIRTPVHAHDLEIDYTALSFVDPQKVVFRYKLDGQDTSWQEAGIRRQAFYNNLPPGHYSFHVVACNNSGVWNNQGATLNFTVPPSWYQTSWFRATVIVVMFCLLWVVYLLRSRRLEREIRYRSEARVAERMRIARELHDTLLQSLQGVVLAFSTFMGRTSAPSDVRQEMEGALDKAEILLISGRERIHDLRSSSAEKKDLATELHFAIQRICSESGARVTVELAGDSGDLLPAVQDEVLWILIEALTNACRHADATDIAIQVLQSHHGLQCSIKDNGRGFVTSEPTSIGSKHFGLRGMNERAERIGGQLEVQSSVGIGTIVTIIVSAPFAYAGLSPWWRRFIRIA